MSNFSNLKVTKLQNQKGKMVGYGSVVVGGLVEVNFTVMEGKSGVFASLPSHKGKDKDGKDTWYPDVRFVDKESYAAFQEEVKKALNLSHINSSGEQSQLDDGLPW